MKIVEFLQKTIGGKLSLEEQKKYLVKKPFGSAEELAEAVSYLYAQMPEAPILEGAIDICGTGGSGLPRINTSTISAFIVAGAGVKVAKHGNNAASGKFGSFDLISAMDIPINLSAQELQLRFAEYNLAFLYAKSFHPVMRHFAPVRSQLKQPTFFNILGPLLSPVKAKSQLIGAPKLEYAKLIAEVSKLLKKERVIVVVGRDGLDEVTLNGSTDVVELNKNVLKQYVVRPGDFGVKSADSFLEISSDNAAKNIKIAEQIIAGEEDSRRTDLVLINSAMALYLAGKSTDLKECYEIAKSVLNLGKAQECLNHYRQPSVLTAIATRDSGRDYKSAGKSERKPFQYSGGLIAEIKRRSPSEGNIKTKLDIKKQVEEYERGGASAISVLTEPVDFNGSFEDLVEVRKLTSLPILCKDFIFSTQHIDKAKSAGADIILLIASVLEPKKLKQLYDYAAKQDLQVIVEVHNNSELSNALELNPKIIGVNSRNLHDFSLNAKLFEDLSSQIPGSIIKVAESGIQKYSDVPKNYLGVLVGTELMRHPFPHLKIKELLGKPLVKMCGIRNPQDAQLCEELGVDMIGINFVPRSKRKADIETAKAIVKKCKSTLTVGVFENQSAHEANEIAKNAGVDAIQLSGAEDNLQEYELPIIKTINLSDEKPAKIFMTIIDSSMPGSGKKIDHTKLEEYEPSLIAGGIDLDTAEVLLKTKKPLGIDTASGIETNGQVDTEKIKALYHLVVSTKY